MVKKLVQVIKEIDSEKETEIIFSGLIQREDHDFRDPIEEINDELKRYYDSKDYRFVENSNIDEGFVNRSKLHLNKMVRLCLLGILPMLSNIFEVRLIVMVNLYIPEILVTMKCLAWTA